jgi:hypothetical protein
MQQKQDTQAVTVIIPNNLLIKVNAYLSEVSQSIGRIFSLSELTSEALDLYLWGVEENKKLEEEREMAELEKK